VVATHVVIFCPSALLHTLVVGGHNLSWLLITPAWGGVWVFFVLAGYLCGKGYASGRYELGWAGCRRFWWNRFLRICVPYYVVVLFVVVLTAPALLVPKGWASLAHLLTFTYYETATAAPLSQTWFVSTLVQLMVLAPMLAVVLTPLLRSRRRAFAVLALVVAVGTVIMVAPLFLFPGTGVEVWWPGWMYVPVWANLDLFVAGYLLNAMVSGPGRERRPWTSPGLAVAVLAVAWLGTAWLAYQGLFLQRHAAWLVFAVGGPLAWLAVAWIWIRMAESQRRDETRRRSGPLRWSLVEFGAAVSFGVYLWHVPVLQSVSAVLPISSALAFWAVLLVSTLVLTTALAVLLRVTVELPARRWRREAAEAQ